MQTFFLRRTVTRFNHDFVGDPRSLCNLHFFPLPLLIPGCQIHREKSANTTQSLPQHPEQLHYRGLLFGEGKQAAEQAAPPLQR